MTTTKTIGRDLPNGDYVEITAEERDDSGTLSAGFAVTLLGWERRGTWSGRAAKRNGREATFGGADHKTILRVAPELGAIVACHLADPSGVPMHAEANGWYFYSGGAADYERKQIAKGDAYRYYAKMLETSDHDRAAQALNIAPADLPAGMDRSAFSAFCASLADRWRDQAIAARAALAALADGDGVE